MKKKLDIENITNELEGASLFFTKPVEKKAEPQLAKTEPTSPLPVTPPSNVDETKKPTRPKSQPKSKKIEKKDDAVIPRNHDTMTPRYHETIIELVRKAVKDFGKEAATHRFTLEEKKAVADIIYTYKSRGLRTSENEIARIAINYIVEDFRENGEASILDKVLKALND